MITPGNYNVTNNQDYLMTKMNNIDLYWSWLGLIIVSVLSIILFFGFIGWCGNIWNECKVEDDKACKKSPNDKKFTQANEFLYLVKSYEDTNKLMGDLSEKDAKVLYLDDIKQHVEDLLPHEKLIIQNMESYNVRTWMKYKNLFFSETK